MIYKFSYQARFRVDLFVLLSSRLHSFLTKVTISSRYLGTINEVRQVTYPYNYKVKIKNTLKINESNLFNYILIMFSSTCTSLLHFSMVTFRLIHYFLLSCFIGTLCMFSNIRWFPRPVCHFGLSLGIFCMIISASGLFLSVSEFLARPITCSAMNFHWE